MSIDYLLAGLFFAHSIFLPFVSIIKPSFVTDSNDRPGARNQETGVQEQLDRRGKETLSGL